MSQPVVMAMLGHVREIALPENSRKNKVVYIARETLHTCFAILTCNRATPTEKRVRKVTGLRYSFGMRWQRDHQEKS
jgi:hypothetical protein